MSDYTPTIEDVRNHYAYGCGPEHTWAESREDFDRWLSERDRQVAERAWDAGFNAARENVARAMWEDGEQIENPHRAKGEQK